MISKYQATPCPEKEPFVLAVVLKDTNELIGHVGLSPYDTDIEIGYAISEKQSKNGYATQAVSAISEWALSNLQTNRIFGIVASENKGSSRVLEKAKYLFEDEKKLKYHGQLRICRRYYLS